MEWYPSAISDELGKKSQLHHYSIRSLLYLAIERELSVRTSV